LDNAILAVDGGGTNCRFALETNGLRQVVTLGAANVSTDFRRAVATLRDGLRLLAVNSGVPTDALASLPAYLGLAGVVDEADAVRVRAALPLSNAEVSDDRSSAVRGALGRANGSLAGLGTGSFFARQNGGAIRLSGGWGSRLADEASGFWIGRTALVATLDTVDGFKPASDLTRALMDQFGGPRGIVAFSISAAPTEVAALAPNVIAAAEAGDPAGSFVLKSGAEHILKTLTAMGWQPGEPLCLIGGVSAAYRAHLPGIAPVPALGTALDGALALARERAGPVPQ